MSAGGTHLLHSLLRGLLSITIIDININSINCINIIMCVIITIAIINSTIVMVMANVFV